MDAVDREDRGHDGWMPWIEKTEDTMDGWWMRRPRTRWVDAVDSEDRGHDGWMPWIEKTEDTMDGCRG